MGAPFYSKAQASLQAALDDAAANLATLEAAGPQQGVTYSLDGESYDWVGAKRYYLDAIERYTKLIQQLDGPWIVKNIGR